MFVRISWGEINHNLRFGLSQVKAAPMATFPSTCSDAVPYLRHNVCIAGQKQPLMQKTPSRRKFCFYAMKILFYRDETKIASSARGESAAVNCPRTNGIGRTAVGGYEEKPYLCLLSLFSGSSLQMSDEPKINHKFRLSNHKF